MSLPAPPRSVSVPSPPETVSSPPSALTWSLPPNAATVSEVSLAPRISVALVPVKSGMALPLVLYVDLAPIVIRRIPLKGCVRLPGLRRRQAEGFRHRAAAGKARDPIGLQGKLRLGITDARPHRCGRECDQAVIVADHEIARRDQPTADGDRHVDFATNRAGRAARRHPPRENRKVRPAGESADIAHGAVAHDSGTGPVAQVAAQNLADHRELRVAA